MYRIVATGLIAILFAASALPEISAEETAKASQSEPEPCPCGDETTAKQAGEESTDDCFWFCPHMEYAQYYNSQGQLVHCYYGAYCSKNTGGSLCYEYTGTPGLPVLMANCNTNCPSSQPAGCRDLTAKGIGKLAEMGDVEDANSSEIISHRRMRTLRRLATQGAKPISGETQPFGKLISSSQYPTEYVGDAIVANLVFAPGKSVPIKVAAIRIEPITSNPSLKPLRIRIGRQYSLGEGEAAPETYARIVRYIKPFGAEQDKTHAVIARVAGRPYLVLLKRKIPIPES